MKFVRPVLLTVSAVSLSLAGGIWLERQQLPYRVVARVESALNGFLDRTPQAQVVRWRNVNTNLHEVQFATVRVSRPTSDGGSLAAIGNNLVISSPLGQLNYLNSKGQLHSLDVRTPMNIDGLRNDPLHKDPLFNVTYFRTHGLLAIQTGDDTYDLYASFNRYAGTCFEFVVSRISLKAYEQTVRPISGWHDVWTAKPCVRLKDRGTRFAGLHSGGRMARLNEDTILISVGDFQFDGYNDSQAAAMDPASDLGKLIELNIRTGVSRHFAMGLRNPQGLVIARDGRIWETEHGPQGGDEVNLMIDGQNYGWPKVTYGMNYGWPPKSWPFSPKPGTHDGYTRPRFAFVPSIGIGNLIEPDPRQFPNWRGTLVLCSLAANALYVLKTEGDDIVYAEPIPFTGYRLRDIVTLHDGRLAILADGGTLLLVRNAESSGGDERVVVEGLASLSPPLPEEALSRRGNGRDRGRQLFMGACASCHSLAGEIGVGPPLNGVVGRPVAAVPGFGYSVALKERNDVWTESLLNAFIIDSKTVVQGTSMPTTGLYVSQARDIVEYLKTTR